MEHKDVKIDAIVSCEKLGITKGRILGFFEGSHTKVRIVDRDKGKGFNKKTETFKGVKIGNNWMRGENKGYRQEHIVHRKELELKELL